MLVTGSSSGIGRACGEFLNLNGWHVYGGCRTPGTVAAIDQLTLDVRDEASVEQAVAEIIRRDGQLDALVHCAGVSLTGPIEETTVAEAKDLFEVNYFGSLRMVRAVLPAMRAARSGRIVIVGSIASHIGLPFLAHYSASKFALEGLMEALRLELAPYGVQASIVHPGDVATAIVAHETRAGRTVPSSPYWRDYQAVSARYKSNVENGLPPETVARAVAKLLQAPRPPVSQFVGSTLELLAVGMKSRLPSRWFEYILRRSYDL